MEVSWLTAALWVVASQLNSRLFAIYKDRDKWRPNIPDSYWCQPHDGMHSTSTGDLNERKNHNFVQRRHPKWIPSSAIKRYESLPREWKFSILTWIICATFVQFFETFQRNSFNCLSPKHIIHITGRRAHCTLHTSHVNLNPPWIKRTPHRVEWNLSSMVFFLYLFLPLSPLASYRTFFDGKFYEQMNYYILKRTSYG